MSHYHLANTPVTPGPGGLQRRMTPKALDSGEGLHLFLFRASYRFAIEASPDRWRERSRFFSGIAKAMSDQWSNPPACAANSQMRLL
jgi:hypothetical protein